MNINRIFIQPSDSGLRNFNKSLWGLVPITTKPEGYFFEMKNEIWKDIPGYEGIYQASTNGIIRSLPRKFKRVRTTEYDVSVRGRILKPWKHNGYLHVMLYNNGHSKSYSNHHIMAITFLGHKPKETGLVVNHINIKRDDNRLENLELVTRRENANMKHLKSASVYTGVTWEKHANKWRSSIHLKQKRIHLGMFNDEHEAHLAYQRALKKIENGEKVIG